MSDKLIAPVVLLYEIPVPALKAPLALALVKYKLLEPSPKSSVSNDPIVTEISFAPTEIPVPAPTLSVTEPLAPPPVKPVPALTFVISPTFVV